MKTLKNVLQEAERNSLAVGHFNFSDLVAFNAIAGAARRLNFPYWSESPRASARSSECIRRASSSGVFVKNMGS